MVERIAARLMISSAAAKKLQKTFQNIIDEGVGGLNWEWDSIAGVGRGSSPTSFSMSAKPAEFEAAMLNGGILVRGIFHSKMREDEVFEFTVDLEAGYYYKTAGEQGPGKLDANTIIQLGDHEVDASSFAYLGSVGPKPDFSGGSKKIQDGIKSLIQSVVNNPPPDALSQSKRSIQKRYQQQQMKDAEESAKEKELQKKIDPSKYGDTEWVVDQLMGKNNSFGPADVRAIIQRRGDQPTPEAYKALRSELENWGLHFNPSLGLQFSFWKKDHDDMILRIAMSLT